MIIGDIFQPGENYAFTFLKEMKEKPVSNHIAFEFFVPPKRHQLERIAESITHFNIEISPESHDEEIRRAFGRPYDNPSLERMIRDAIEFGCKRIDVFFMTGLPKQTAQSVLDTEYCLPCTGAPPRKLLPFIFPLPPSRPWKHGLWNRRNMGIVSSTRLWRNIGRPCWLRVGNTF
jgi:radical SAM superfamily enzyme YgiQ (UPF0313 family)